MMTLRPVEPKDLPDVSRFLVRTYQVDAASNLSDTAFLEWKYLIPRPGSVGSRSFVLEKEGKIVAHGGICPASFRLPSGNLVSAITIMDWAADPAFPGAGITLFSKLMKLADTVFIVGGSPATRQILPHIGFRPVGEALTFARWVRPWKEFRTRAVTGRSLLRLAHGLTTSMRQAPYVQRLNVQPATQFDDSLRPLLENRELLMTTCQRTISDLNYLLQCPAGPVKGYLLLESGDLRGYFILGRALWEARLLDVFVNSGNLEEWRHAYAAATSIATADPDVCRIRAVATTPLHGEALRGSGYWKQFKEPIMIHDPRGFLAGAFPASFQLFDGDAGY
jgi:hypothetical protein